MSFLAFILNIEHSAAGEKIDVFKRVEEVKTYQTYTPARIFFNDLK